MNPQTSADSPARFRDQHVTFASGTSGRNIAIPSASPVNYFQAVSEPGSMPKITIDGKLFLPPQAKRLDDGPLPLVILAAGSLGVGDSIVKHAETLTDHGLASFVLDSFGARGVTSTVAKQTQFSFAASSYDVLAAWEVLSGLPEIDARRIGAQGHSRGGSAVMIAATRRFADAIVGRGKGLKAVLAAYPWSGQQFLDPSVGDTEVRVLMGDADEWCSASQVQGHCQAIRLTGGTATMRLFGGTHHSFDRGTAVVNIPEASVSPGAPTTYIADNGALVHPLEAEPNPELVDYDVMIYAVKSGHGNKGARLGSIDGEAEAFRDDMVAFWRRVLAA